MNINIPSQITKITIFTHRRVAKLENETICAPQNEFATICRCSRGAQLNIPDTWVRMCTPQHHGRIGSEAKGNHPASPQLDLDGATLVVANIWVASWQTSSSSSSSSSPRRRSRGSSNCATWALFVYPLWQAAAASCGLMTSPRSSDMQKFLTHR